MKLYEIPEGSKIQVLMEDGSFRMLTFDHVDGMYSFCTLDGVEGEEGVVNLYASTELELRDGYYIIANENQSYPQV